MLTEILSTVGASSINDLSNAAQSCKVFHKAADDKLVYQRLNINDLSFRPFRPKECYIHQRCMEVENTDALTEEGIAQYFITANEIEGLKLLKRAAEKGNSKAQYLYGIIAIISPFQEHENTKAMELLSLIIEGRNGRQRPWKIAECRRLVRQTFTRLWALNKRLVAIGHNLKDCQSPHDRPNLPDTGAYISSPICYKPCMWRCEAKLFCKFLKRTALNI